MDNERNEEYLESIYKEQSKGEPASTSFLARDLGVSQPAVTDMMKNLESKGLIDYKSSVMPPHQARGHLRTYRTWLIVRGYLHEIGI
jgi:predicted ArsR family transcriptional regulator